MFGLDELLARTFPRVDPGRDGFFAYPGDHTTPGFWTAYAARARKRNLRLAELAIPGDKLEYAKAIAIEPALGEPDTYRYNRSGAAITYSPLVLLDTPERTETAAHEINGVIRKLFSQVVPGAGEVVCDLVGDLLDNVWAHGKSTGFSMAQTWQYADGHREIEVSVADQGIGFLRELHRAAIQDVATDRDAIAWCIQEGHSTKKRPVEDWSQRVPADAIENPMPGIGRIVESESHHLGLGLAKLVRTIEDFHGRLWLASGAAMLAIDPDGRRRYRDIPVPWEGVAIAARFDSTSLVEHFGEESEDEFDRFMQDWERWQR
jgi:hypothetical protein